MVLREGATSPSASAAVEAGYAAGTTDEFILPSVIDPGGVAAGEPLDPRVRDGDTVLFFNFRADRARQIARALTGKDFAEFTLPARPALASFVCFTTYDRTWTLPVVFPPQHLAGTFGEAVSA